MTTLRLELDRLSGGYRPGADAVHQVCLRFEPGLHLLAGPNGAGKTTLLRLICGVLTPSDGGVRLLLDGSPAPVRAGYVSHAPAIFTRLSVLENLCYWSRLLGLGPEPESIVLRAAANAGAVELLERRHGSLSRGERQRVAITRALIGEAPLLVLDEPLTGLDLNAADGLSDQLRSLATAGRIVIVTSHELQHFERLADSFTVLVAGTVRFNGAGDDLDMIYRRLVA